MAELVVGGEHGCVVVHHQAPEVEHDPLVSDRECAAGVLLDEQHGESLALDQREQKVEDLRDDPRGEAQRGFRRAAASWATPSAPAR